jgi:transposase
VVIDLDRARRRLGAFLLRHGQVWRGGSKWTLKHEDWLLGVRFHDAALATTYGHYRSIVHECRLRLQALEADLLVYCDKDPYAEGIHRLCCYRGVNTIGALTLVSEVCDWRRFARASSFMGFVGLVVSEYSSGERTQRGHITKAGNEHLRTQLVESAWAYQSGPFVGPRIRRAQEQCPPATAERAWAAQVRLCGRFRRLAARKNVKSVVATAVARELAGFLWGEMTA